MAPSADELHPPQMCTVQGQFEGGVYFIQFEPDNRYGNNSRVGRIESNTICTCIYALLISQVTKNNMWAIGVKMTLLTDCEQ